MKKGKNKNKRDQDTSVTGPKKTLRPPQVRASGAAVPSSTGPSGPGAGGASFTKAHTKAEDQVRQRTGPQTTPSRVDAPSNTGPSGSGVQSAPLTKSQKRNRRKYRANLAREQSAPSDGGSGQGVKRTSSELSTPSPTSKAAPAKRPRGEIPHRSFTQVVAGTKMAIVKGGFPQDKLSTTEDIAIQKEIVKKTDSLPLDVALPCFSNSGLNKGAYIVQCDNDYSVEWLKSNFHNNVDLIKGTQLKVIKASELPKPVKVAFKHKDVHTVDPQVLLKRLNRFNPKLNTSCWRVLDKRLESQSARWIFEVDIESAEAIRDANYTVYAGLDLGIFKILSGPIESGQTTDKTTGAGGVSTASGDGSTGEGDLTTASGGDVDTKSVDKIDDLTSTETGEREPTVSSEKEGITEAGETPTASAKLDTEPATEMEVEENQPDNSLLDTVSEESDSVVLGLTELSFSDSDSISTVLSFSPEKRRMEEVEDPSEEFSSGAKEKS